MPENNQKKYIAMKNFLNKIHRSASQFSMVDFAIFKIYLFAVGILFGAYFARFWFAHINIVWIVAIAGGIATITQLARNYFKGSSNNSP